MVNDINIAVIGAGPAGLSCATQLAKLSQEVIVFERQTKSGGTPLHCGHKGFGMLEFQRVLTGPQYGELLTKKAKNAGVDIRLRHSLYKIEDDILHFATPNGVKKYRAKRVVFALGVRESHRSNYFISGIRSPNIITTGALQRFVYEYESIPFKSGTIYNTELVSFSALATSKKSDIDIKTMVEKEKNIKSFSILKPLSEKFFETVIRTGVKDISIYGEDKKISHVAVKKGDRNIAVECEGVIFTGGFRPESAILQERFKDFNHTNKSVNTTQAFRLSDGRFFATGNVLRGALAAFKCYFEGKRCANFVDNSLKEEKEQEIIKIKFDSDEVDWFTPTMIDLNIERKYLTKLRFKKEQKGELKVLLNGKPFIFQGVNAKPYETVTIPWINFEVKKGDKIEIVFTTAPRDI
ncbi:MAG: NAD(P)-binding protein [Epsilonproteobacteria bacterium]|nr:NAD(P)-binding protein [Campylobacterota bacterium]